MIRQNPVYKSQNLLHLSYLDRSLLSSGQLSSYVNNTKGIYGSQLLPTTKVSPKSDIIQRKCTHDRNFKDMLSHIGTSGELFRQTIGRPKNAFDDYSMKGPELTREEQLMTHWPSYLMSEEHPKIIGKNFLYLLVKKLDFYINRACYLWIECARKSFPAQILSNIRGLDLEYCVDLISLSDLIDYNPCTSVFKCKHIKSYVCEKSIQQLRIDPGQIVRQLKFDQHFKKPNPDACDIRSYGDTAIINPTKKHKDTGKDIHFMAIYVMAPKPCRIMISMSFSGFRINTQPDHFIDRGFGDLVKKFCNNESDSDRKPSMRKKKKPPQKHYPNPIATAAASLIMTITKSTFIKKKDPTDFDVTRWTNQGRGNDKIISNKRNHQHPLP
jgi:hypothetical protein